MRDDRPEALSHPDTLDRRETADWPRQDDPESPAELNRRLDSLPDGHPSSRYEADGTPRESPARLSDLETPPDEDEKGLDDPSIDFDLRDSGAEAERNTDPERSDTARPADQTRPVTDAEWAEHVTDVRDGLGKADAKGLATDRQYTTDEDREQWTPARDRIQGDLVADLYQRSGHVPCDRTAIVAGGLGGAGKSTTLSKHAGIEMSKYLTINPDSIKEEMALRGLIPEVEGLTPMEASDLVHEESSAVAKQLARKAMADGKNIIWDITMSSRESTERRVVDLRAAGYTVDGIFVDIPVETSVRRVDARHRDGHNDYRAGIGIGGRYVPPEVIRAQADPDWGSKNRKTFEDVNHLLDHWSRYDNSVDGRSPLLVQTDRPHDENPEEKV
jgi:predicted kinase